MKKKIAILGSTGSIGKTLIEIVKKDKKNFEIVLLSAEGNYKELLKQAKFFKVKNLIIYNKASYLKVKKDRYSKKIKIFNNFNNFNKIFKKRIDYVMSSISGIEGFKPTIEIIKYTKKIAIANKEAIICGWDLIEKQLKRNKTEFVPVDSEHFSIWYALRNINKQLIERLENRFQDTLDMHEDFMIEAVGGDPDTATLEQKKAVFNIMTALHDIISVQDQMEMPN